jgi:uncharacterized protein Veg
LHGVIHGVIEKSQIGKEAIGQSSNGRRKKAEKSGRIIKWPNDSKGQN